MIACCGLYAVSVETVVHLCTAALCSPKNLVLYALLFITHVDIVLRYDRSHGVNFLEKKFTLVNFSVTKLSVRVGFSTVVV